MALSQPPRADPAAALPTAPGDGIGKNLAELNESIKAGQEALLRASHTEHVAQVKLSIAIQDVLLLSQISRQRTDLRDEIDDIRDKVEAHTGLLEQNARRQRNAARLAEIRVKARPLIPSASPSHGVVPLLDLRWQAGNFKALCLPVAGHPPLQVCILSDSSTAPLPLLTSRLCDAHAEPSFKAQMNSFNTLTPSNSMPPPGPPSTNPAWSHIPLLQRHRDSASLLQQSTGRQISAIHHLQRLQERTLLEHGIETDRIQNGCGGARDRLTALVEQVEADFRETHQLIERRLVETRERLSQQMKDALRVLPNEEQLACDTTVAVVQNMRMQTNGMRALAEASHTEAAQLIQQTAQLASAVGSASAPQGSQEPHPPAKRARTSHGSEGHAPVASTTQSYPNAAQPSSQRSVVPASSHFYSTPRADIVFLHTLMAHPTTKKYVQAMQMDDEVLIGISSYDAWLVQQQGQQQKAPGVQAGVGPVQRDWVPARALCAPLSKSTAHNNSTSGTAATGQVRTAPTPGTGTSATAHTGKENLVGSSRLTVALDWACASGTSAPAHAQQRGNTSTRGGRQVIVGPVCAVYGPAYRGRRDSVSRAQYVIYEAVEKSKDGEDSDEGDGDDEGDVYSEDDYEDY
ncbi:hypothetical protein OC844_006011 [Tilletia horrida]|nr:hypothetical protein OC844_006011 [Tilletia horrida]